MKNTELIYKAIGSIGTNCYILKNIHNGKGIIIDPADDGMQAEALIKRADITPAAVLLTHGHYDHMLVARSIADTYGISIYAGEHEKEVLSDPNVNLSAYTGHGPVSACADCWVKDGEELDIAGIVIKAIYTPGHTEGGMSYYVEEIQSLFSGDTLFEESVGRTDFVTGSMSQIVESVKNRLFVLPDETQVYPGHGDMTMIAHEKMYNPFCR